MTAPQKTWTSGEVRDLAVLADLGDVAVARILHRTRDSVRHKASSLGISVKKTSEIAGTELVQATIDVIMRRDPSFLCPACGKAPAGPSGICGVCYKQGLIDEHERRIAETEAQRALWRAQQRSSRARRSFEREKAAQ